MNIFLCSQLSNNCQKQKPNLEHPFLPKRKFNIHKIMMWKLILECKFIKICHIKIVMVIYPFDYNFIGF